MKAPMKSVSSRPGHVTMKSLLVPAAVVLMSGLATSAHAAGLNVLEINSPGPALRMSTSGAVAGFYVAKCVTLSSQPKRTICYNAPWMFDGKRVAKLSNAFPSNANAMAVAVNDSLELVGADLTGAWYYSNGKTSYVDVNNTNARGSRLYAVNNNGVAVGMSWVSSVYRAITYRFNGLMETPLAPGYGAADINDAGMITGTFNNGTVYQGFVAEAGGTITPVPNLDPAISCRPVRISQVNASGAVWVAGNCDGNRPFVYELRSNTLVELKYPGSSNLSVVSVNSKGQAAGTAVRPGTYAPDGYTALLWTTDYAHPTDLNANQAFAPTTAWNVHGTDINEAGTVLASYNDTSGSFYTFLLTPTP